MRWRPRNVGVWKKRFLVIPKVCRDCGVKFCFELGWKVKSEMYMLVKLGNNRSNRFPIDYEWYCNSCRKQYRDKKIQDLARKFFRGPEETNVDIVGQLLGFTGNAVPTKTTRKVRKLKVK